MHIFKYPIILLSLICLLTNCTSTGSNTPRSIDHEEAIIILGGEMGTKKDLIHITDYFRKNCKYDVYNISYKSRKGIDYCTDNLEKEINKLPLKRYKRVNFFCFILGGMALRNYLDHNSIDNLGNVVLIKGPLDENLAKVAVDVYPDPILKMVKGKTLFDLSKIVYKSFSDTKSNIGIIIEIEPNKLGDDLVKKLKKKQKKYEFETTYFHPDSLFSGYNDFMYQTLNHNEMYQNPQLYISEILNFFKTGTFGLSANRDKTEYSIKYFPKPI